MHSYFSAMKFSLATILMMCCVSVASAAQPPVPVISGARITSTASVNSVEQYTYTYSVTNPATSTGEIRDIRVDITHRLEGWYDNPSNNVPQYKFAVEQALVQRDIKILPTDLQGPAGWASYNMSVDGEAAWGATKKGPLLTPGKSLTGFILKAQYYPPGLRRVTLVPDISTWNLYPDADDPENVQRERETLIASLDLKTYALGPAGVYPGAYAHWNMLRDNLSQALSLGWCANTTSGNTLVTQLASARAALDVSDGTLAKTRLNTLLATLSRMTTADCRTEVLDLVRLNAQSLIAHTANTPIPFEPKVTISPKSVELNLGSLCTITAKAVNVADNNRPIPGYGVGFEIAEGPNAGISRYATTDVSGEARFEYVGNTLGTDRVVSGEGGEGVIPADQATVLWSAAPDLVVPLFTPPYTTGQSQRIYIADITENIGRITSPPSVTRYFVSTIPFTEANGLSGAIFLGERQVPSLSSGESNRLSPTIFTLPDAVSGNPLYFAACADGPGSIVEENENNNCSFNKLSHSGSTVGEFLSPNQPPDCYQAKPGIATLWPPNHKLTTVLITGVTDPDNDPVTIKVERITQDEPVNGLGDGDTSPDGFGIGKNQAQLRAERSGTGNGRVYTVSFSADDGKGGSCTGSVHVGVPHDQGQGSVPVDDGQKYDSTQP